MSGSPCRISDGPRRHRCSAWHAQLVTGYYDARAAQEGRAEECGMGYAEETRAFYGDRDVATADVAEKRVTFKRWLISHRGRAVEIEMQERVESVTDAELEDILARWS